MAALVVGGEHRLPTRTELAEVGPDALGAPPSAHAARFLAARQDPACATALAMRPPTPSLPSNEARLAVLMALVFAFLVVWTVNTSSLFMQLFGLGGMVMWALTARTMLGPVWRFRTATTQAVLACVVARDARSRSDGQGVVEISHQATLELEDGRRLVLGSDDDIVAALVEGDLGVAYWRAGTLIGFRRLAG